MLGAGLRPLARAFTGALASRHDPFERLLVCAPNRDVQAWLEQEVSQDLGIFMNVESESLSRALARCAAEVLGHSRATWETRSLTRAVLHAFERMKLEQPDAWSRIARLLKPAAPTVDGRAHRSRGLSAASRSRRRVQLAQTLASQLLAYDDTHPHLLDQWERGEVASHHPEASWQAALWRTVVDGRARGGELRGAMPDALDSTTDGNRAPVRVRTLLDEVVRSQGDLTTRLVVFGFAHLSPLERDIVSALGERFGVTVYLDTLRPEHDWSRDPQSLLCRWGAPARETREALASSAAIETLSHNDTTTRGTALHALQQALVAPRTVAAPAVLDDGSVRLLGAPGRRREAEVLTNALWDALLDERARTLLNDVTVLSVDYEAQIPWLEDRFAGIGGLLHSAPHGGRASRILDVAVELLTLSDSKARRDAVLAVVTHPCFRGGLDPERASALCRDAGIYLGFDGDEEELRYTGDVPLYSWEQGLARLLLGCWLDDVTACVVAGAEVETVAVSDARSEARSFSVTVSSLLADLTALGDAQLSGAGWADVLEDLVRTYLAPRTQEDATHFAALLGGIHGLTALDDGGTSGDSLPIDYVTAVAVLRASLGTHGGAVGRFRTRGVAVGRLSTNRGVPFGTVCVSGLTEGTFPTRDSVPPLDVRHRDPSPPRFCRELQQLAFLQAVLSAERRLVLSYEDHDAEKDAARAPSSVVGELLEAFPVTWLREQARVKHPLFSHSGRYFGERASEAPRDELPVLRSHDLGAALDWDALLLRQELDEHVKRTTAGASESALSALSLQRGLAREDLRERAGLVAPLPSSSSSTNPPTRRLSFWKLRDVLKDPLAASAESNLRLKGWNLDHDEEALREHEPFDTTDFLIWKLTQRVLRTLFESSAEATPNAPPSEQDIARVAREEVAREERRGALPFGPLCPPEARERPRARALELVTLLFEDYGAFERRPYRGAVVLGSTSLRGARTMSRPPLRLSPSAGPVELTHSGSMLFGDISAPLLVGFHGRAGRAPSSASRDNNDDLRLHLEVMLLSAAGVLEEGALVTSLCLDGGTTPAPVSLRAPSAANARSYLEDLTKPLSGGLHPFHLPLTWTGLDLVREVADVLDDKVALASRHAALLRKLALRWPGRDTLAERAKEPVRDLSGARAPSLQELASVVRERFVPLLRLEAGLDRGGAA